MSELTKQEVENLSWVLSELSDHGPGTEDYLDQFREQYDAAWETIGKLEAEVTNDC